MITECVPSIAAIVEEITGEPLRFHVSSRRKGIDPYLVDLEEYDGNGFCGCEDFQYHHQPKLESGSPPGDSTRCFHILQARAYLADQKIAEAIDWRDA